MHNEFFIVHPVNDTDYRFQIQFNRENPSQCFLTISFLSSENDWVMMFEKEEMLKELGVWKFKRKELPEALLQKEKMISQNIKAQQELV